VRTNKSSFVAANETLTTKCYFSVMDNDMESLSLTYLIIIIIILNNIQNYLLSIHYTFSGLDDLHEAFTRRCSRKIISAPKIYVANPDTILVRHHLIASSFPTYCRKRKPVILATAEPIISTEKYRPCGYLPILGAALNINLSVGRAWLFDKSLSSA
jgi:hypothetical protein